VILNAAHRAWALGTALAAAASAVLYVLAARSAPGGPSGGSGAGIVLGSAAFALMIVAGLLGARRRFRTRRFARASVWLKIHIWVSLLAFVLGLLHAAFRLGGPMTTSVMLLLVVVTASGVWGLALQQSLPRAMTRAVPFETVFEELPRVLERMRDEADARVEAVCGPLADDETIVGLAHAGSAPLRRAYLDRVRPFFDRRPDRRSSLWVPSSIQSFFEQLAATVPGELEPTVEALEALCEERRQLALQARLQVWLHAWLLVHVPLSYALLVLTAVHAAVALRY